MKTTLEIPDSLFRRAKSAAAERGITLRLFVTEAVKTKLDATGKPDRRPWMKHFGKLKDLSQENKRITKDIQDTFEQIDPEMWK